jgi:ribosomal-protein-alanine N-acetyltransferase
MIESAVAGHGPVLETERLLLRPFTADDLDDFARICGDPVVMRFYPAPWTREEARAFIEREIASEQEQGWSRRAVIHRAGGRLIGFCGLKRQQVENEVEVEVGYMLDRAYWGQGLAPEAARAWLTFAFDRLGLPRVISLIRPENTPSIRVAEKNGLRHERDVTYGTGGFRHRVYVAERQGVAQDDR